MALKVTLYFCLFSFIWLLIIGIFSYKKYIKNNRNNFFIYVGIGTVVFAILMPLNVLLAFYFSEFSAPESKRFSDYLGTTGDFLGGTMVGMLTLASIFFIVSTLRLQQDTLNIQKKDLKETQLEFKVMNLNSEFDQLDSHIYRHQDLIFNHINTNFEKFNFLFKKYQWEYNFKNDLGVYSLEYLDKNKFKEIIKIALENNLFEFKVFKTENGQRCVVNFKKIMTLDEAVEKILNLGRKYLCETENYYSLPTIKELPPQNQNKYLTNNNLEPVDSDTYYKYNFEISQRLSMEISYMMNKQVEIQILEILEKNNLLIEEINDLKSNLMMEKANNFHIDSLEIELFFDLINILFDNLNKFHSSINNILTTFGNTPNEIFLKNNLTDKLTNRINVYLSTIISRLPKELILLMEIKYYTNDGYSQKLFLKKIS